MSSSSSVLDDNVNIVKGAGAIVTVDDNDRPKDVSRPPPLHGALDKDERTFWRTGLYYVYAAMVLTAIVITFLLSMLFRGVVKLILLIKYGHRCELVQDRNGAVWGYDWTHSSANICFIFRCQGLPDLEQMMQTFQQRVLDLGTGGEGNEKRSESCFPGTAKKSRGPYYKLRCSLRRKYFFHCWDEDQKFDLRNHFLLEAVPKGKEDERVRELCEGHLEKALDSDRPQWEFRVICPSPVAEDGEGSEGGAEEKRSYAIVFTVHHLYGDGISWMQMFTKCLADEIATLPVDPMRKPKGKVKQLTCVQKVKKWLRVFVSRIVTGILMPPMCLAQLVDMVYEKRGRERCRQLKDASSPSAVPEGKVREKRCRLAACRVPLTSLKSLQRKYNEAKPAEENSLLFTSMLMSATSNAFYRSLEKLEGKLPRQIITGCPYALYPYKSLKPQNNFVLTIARFRSSVASGGIQQLHALNNIVKKSAKKRRIAVNRMAIYMGGSMPIPLMKIAVNLTCRCSIGLSNLPGPTKAFSMFGSQVTNFNFFPPIKFRNSVIVGVLTYNGTVHASVSVDAHALPQTGFPSEFMQSMEEELAEMVAVEPSRDLYPSTAPPDKELQLQIV